jgi:hypothetical protein
MSDFGSKARQGTAPIGDSRKAELAKELDPIVLKVYFHFFFTLVFFYHNNIK